MSKSLRLLQLAFGLTGVALLTIPVSDALQARTTRLEAQALAATATSASGARLPGGSAGSSAILGRLEIPQLAFSAPVLNNDDPASLTRGVGHVPGSATPGGLGNLVLAGHRDTFFRPLEGIKPGMVMDMVTPAARFRYQVARTEIVTPDAVQVMEVGDRPEMTLITCYPFHFIGAAPRRFIVHAFLISDPG